MNTPHDPKAAELAKLRQGGQVLDAKAKALLHLVEGAAPAAKDNPDVQRLAADVEREETTRFSPATGHTTASLVEIERAELEALHNDLTTVSGEEAQLMTPKSPALVDIASHPHHPSASGESVLGKARRGKDVRRERELLEEEEKKRRLLNISREQILPGVRRAA